MNIVFSLANKLDDCLPSEKIPFLAEKRTRLGVEYKGYYWRMARRMLGGPPSYNLKNIISDAYDPDSPTPLPCPRAIRSRAKLFIRSGDNRHYHICKTLDILNIRFLISNPEQRRIALVKSFGFKHGTNRDTLLEPFKYFYSSTFHSVGKMSEQEEKEISPYLKDFLSRLYTKDGEFIYTFGSKAGIKLPLKEIVLLVEEVDKLCTVSQGKAAKKLALTLGIANCLREHESGILSDFITLRAYLLKFLREAHPPSLEEAHRVLKGLQYNCSLRIANFFDSRDSCIDRIKTLHIFDCFYFNRGCLKVFNDFLEALGMPYAGKTLGKTFFRAVTFLGEHYPLTLKENDTRDTLKNPRFLLTALLCMTNVARATTLANLQKGSRFYHTFGAFPNGLGGLPKRFELPLILALAQLPPDSNWPALLTKIQQIPIPFLAAWIPVLLSEGLFVLNNLDDLLEEALKMPFIKTHQSYLEDKDSELHHDYNSMTSTFNTITNTHLTTLVAIYKHAPSQGEHLVRRLSAAAIFAPSLCYADQLSRYLDFLATFNEEELAQLPDEQMDQIHSTFMNLYLYHHAFSYFLEDGIRAKSSRKDTNFKKKEFDKLLKNLRPFLIGNYPKLHELFRLKHLSNYDGYINLYKQEHFELFRSIRLITEKGEDESGLYWLPSELFGKIVSTQANKQSL